ncbi:flocculation protein FLO11-like [Leptopilina heterotoma]|uniref:flocculation protein FLO11-like n=1 Tax=Leptopilina heterotoma TaxID=63436 RepID=UPI001CA8A7CF|nr:flocculation protein FLO11-like [Leptopilina heterotoma]
MRKEDRGSQSECGSVDTLDCPPPPALPPRRPPWPPNNLSPSTLRILGSSTSSSSVHQVQQHLQVHELPSPPPPPPLTPPNYPAPPRPPSRNGGDEARVARAGGSGRGAPCCTLANGTPSPRTLPPRAGWAVRTTNPSHTTPFLPAAASSSTTTSASAAEAATQWGSERALCSPLSSKRLPIPSPTTARSDTSATNANVRQHNDNSLLTKRTLASPGTTTRSYRTDCTVPMSRTAASPPSRPPSSASTNSSLARVHGHDHTRPLPPPRLPDTTALPNFTPLTIPLAPLSSSNSFRSRTPVTSVTTSSSRVPNGDATIDTGTSTTRNRSSNESPRSAVGEVTLTVPRPDGDRIANEYVETPFRPILLQTQGRTLADAQKCPKTERRLQQQQQKAAQYHNSQRHRRQNHLLQSAAPVGNNAITKQPVSFTKEPANALGSPNSRSTDSTGLSIMCDFCGRCRCESCREPPPLPSRWLCDNSCFCSAETVLDYASCLCCVKGLFYHCADSGSGVESENGNCADEPCSCTGSRKTARWACLGALTLVLPCLLCYWPFKGCVAVCEACYARHKAQGCRCEPTTLGRHHPGVGVLRDSRDPEKRLLDPVTPEL